MALPKDVVTTTADELDELTEALPGDKLIVARPGAPVAKIDAGELYDLAGVATKTLVNVEPTDFARKAFPIPIGSTGVGMVPSSLKGRWKHYANAVTDFGISLYEGNTTTLKDNQAELQAAIDALRKYNGALFIPPQDGQDLSGGQGQAAYYLTGPLTLRNDPSVDGLGVALVGLGAGERTRGLAGRYDAGVGLKLAPHSNQPLITSKSKAGHLQMYNIISNGNSGQQDVNCRGVYLEDRTDGLYGYGMMCDHAYFQDFKGSGFFQGGNRGETELWSLGVEYCGNSVDAAVVLGSADTILYNPAIGVNAGVNLYVGSCAQLQIYGGAFWMSGLENVIISEYAQSVVFTTVHFDHPGTHNIRTVASTVGGSLLPLRQLIGCFFSDASLSADNTFCDIIVGNGDTALQVIGCAFQGAADNSKLPLYCIGFQDAAGRVQLVGARHNAASYRSAFTNSPSQILGDWPQRASAAQALIGAAPVAYSQSEYQKLLDAVAEVRATLIEENRWKGAPP
jgi:hypothetical protein